MNKSQYILVGIAALLALFVFTLALFSFFRPQSEVSNTTSGLTPTTAESSPILYEESSTEKMLDIVKQTPSLAPSDLRIRNVLIAKASEGEYLYSSTTVRLEYLSSPDQFMAEILTSDIESAKSEAVSFFSEQGLSNEAICHLPLIFYLSLQARRALPENTTFNPLPNNC